MADFGSLRKKNRLGVPPQKGEIKNNLQLPETHDESQVLLDGRSKRRTGRTHQLATRVRFDFYKKVKQIALDEDITIAELLEKAVEKYQDSSYQNSR